MRLSKTKTDGRNSVYILGVEAKDLYAAKRLLSPIVEDGVVQGYVNHNLKRWKNTLDYSLDLIKLREVAYQHYSLEKTLM